MAQAFFVALAERIHKSHRLILWSAAALTLLSILLATQLQIDSSFDSLMPSGDREAKNLLADLLDSGPQDVLVVVVEVPDPSFLEGGKLLLDEFVRHMASFPGIGNLEARFTQRYERFFADILLPHAALFLNEQKRGEMRRRLSDAAIASQIAETRRLLLMPLWGRAGELISRDPLGLMSLWLSSWFAQQTFAGLEVDDGYLVDKDHTHLFLFVRPHETARNIAYTKQLMAAASSAAEAALSIWRRSEFSAGQTPSFLFGGGYAIALEDEALTRRDLQTNVLLSSLGVLLLFYLLFRSLRILFLMFLPLAASILWTFGALKLVVGHVNVLTGAFAAVLLGLGIDFAIHLLNLYLTGLQTEDSQNALQRALIRGGPPIALGGLTTAAAFLTLASASFRGLRELGIITSIGMCACLLAMLVVLPALLVRHQRGGNSLSGQAARLPTFGLDRLARFVTGHPRWTVGVSLVLLAFLAFASFRVSFEEDIRALRPQGSASMRVEKKIEAILGGASGFLILVMDGASEEVLLERARRLNGSLERLQSEGRLSHYQTILTYWPAPESQKRALAFLADHAAELDPDRIQGAVERALRENGFQFLPEHQSYIRWLRSLVRPSSLVDRTTFEEARLTGLLEPFLRGAGERKKLFTFLYPRAGLWRADDLKALRLDILGAVKESGLAPDEWRLAGWPFLAERLKALVWRDLKGSLALAGLAIALTLLAAFRSLPAAVLAALPLLTGLIAMLGIMALAHLPFNYANFIVLPIMIGIGIDNGIHMVSRWRGESGERSERVLSELGRALVLCSLTTVVGFGSLVSSHYPGLRSIGWVVGIAMLTTLLASLLFLPAVLALIEQRRRRIEERGSRL